MARQAVQCRVWPSAAPMTRPAAPGCLMCSSRAARPCCCTDVLIDVSRLSSGLRGYGSRCLRRVCTTLLQYVSSFAHAADPRIPGFPWQGSVAAAEHQCLQFSATSSRMARWMTYAFDAEVFIVPFGEHGCHPRLVHALPLPAVWHTCSTCR